MGGFNILGALGELSNVAKFSMYIYVFFKSKLNKK